MARPRQTEFGLIAIGMMVVVDVLAFVVFDVSAQDDPIVVNVQQAPVGPAEIRFADPEINDRFDQLEVIVEFRPEPLTFEEAMNREGWSEIDAVAEPWTAWPRCYTQPGVVPASGWIRLRLRDPVSGMISEPSNAKPVPEPASALLIGSGICGVLALARLRRRRTTRSLASDDSAGRVEARTGDPATSD